MDRSIRESQRDGDLLRTALLLRRAARLDDALDALEEAWVALPQRRAEVALAISEVLDAAQAITEPLERLPYAAALDRLTWHGVPGAAERWRAWFPSAAHLVGWSPPLRALRAFLYEHAASAAPVVLEGESGTGHALAARTLHALSGRTAFHEAYAPGSRRRLLTEVENDPPLGGTLYLSYANEAHGVLPAVLESCTRRDVRLVIGLVGDPTSALFVRPAGVDAYPTHRIAPLRERLEDLRLLVEELLARAGAPQAAQALTDANLSMLSWPSWPGNVRELANHVSRAVLAAPRPEDVAELLVQNLFGLPGEVSEGMG